MEIKRFFHQSHSLENCFPVPNQPTGSLHLTDGATCRLGPNQICSNVFTKHSNAYKKEPNVDEIAVNGTAIINMFKPGQSKTFEDYDATDIFLSCVQNRVRNVQHVDVSWDNYFNDSLKAKHEKNMKKEYGEESKLTQECLTTGKLS